MFSSTTNAYLLPRLSPPPPFLGCDATDFFLQYHSDLLLTDTLFGMVVSNKPPARNQEASTELNGQSFGPKSVLPKTKKAAKKHKHSKIFTAQGLRDRRVRLSIQTARKFFDLQDMLGFEKASKTIDWLLKNSKAEIKDLMNKVKDGSSGGVKRSTLTSTASGCEVASAGAYEGTKMKELEIKLLKDRAAAFDERYLASRESRARARERARERTREKKILRSKLKGSPISSDEQNISEDNFEFVPRFGRPATSTASGYNKGGSDGLLMKQGKGSGGSIRSVGFTNHHCVVLPMKVVVEDIRCEVDLLGVMIFTLFIDWRI